MAPMADPHSASPQIIGFLTLAISSSILLLLAGLTVTATILGLIFFVPLLILFSPLWLPLGAFLFFTFAGFLFVCGFGLAGAVALSWMYKNFKGMEMDPPGRSGRVGHGRSRVYEKGSYVKDAAPGA